MKIDLRCGDALTKKQRASATGKYKRRLIRLTSCQCESCGWRPPTLEYVSLDSIMNVHHIVPCCEGGTHTDDNLILLCPNCHAIAHSIYCVPWHGRSKTRPWLLSSLRDPAALVERHKAEIERRRGVYNEAERMVREQDKMEEEVSQRQRAVRHEAIWAEANRRIVADCPLFNEVAE